MQTPSHLEPRVRPQERAGQSVVCPGPANSAPAIASCAQCDNYNNTRNSSQNNSQDNCPHQNTFDNCLDNKTKTATPNTPTPNTPTTNTPAAITMSKATMSIAKSTTLKQLCPGRQHQHKHKPWTTTTAQTQAMDDNNSTTEHEAMGDNNTTKHEAMGDNNTTEHEAATIYSQNDIDLVTRKICDKTVLENKMLLLELHVLKLKYEAALSANADAGMALYEQARLKQEAMRFEAEHNAIQRDIEALIYEKQLLQTELSTIHSSFHDIRRRYDDKKRTAAQLLANENIFRNRIDSHKTAIAAAESQLLALRRHVDERLVEADNALYSRTSLPTSETAIIKNRCKKMESTAAELENLLEAKQAENKELYSIWDELSRQVQQ